MSSWTDRPEGVPEVSMALSRTRTWGGLETEASYGPGSGAGGGLDYERDLGEPGQFPYTRGAYPQMYRSRMWTLRNIVGYGTPEDTRDGIERALAAGSAGIDIIPDNCSQQAIDPDHPIARRDVGLEGCSIACVDDLERLLDGIDVTKTDIAWHFTILLYPMLAAMARRQGKDIAQLQGGHMPDCLVLNPMGQGEKIMPARLAHRVTLDCLEFISQNSPSWSCGFPQTYDAVQRGLTPAGEIAVGMAIVRRTFRDLAARGADLDAVARIVAWVSPAGIDLFEEVAKFRAIRRFWARTMRDEFGTTSPRSQRLRIASHTDGRAMTYQQPLNNLARGTVQTLAAILGGAQSVETCTYDEAIAIPTPESRELAIRTQQILIHETGVARTADPLGGSWYVEALTDQVEARALEFLTEIEERGIVEVIESGWLESRMDEVNATVRDELASKERIIVGVNEFRTDSEPAPVRFDFDRTSLTHHLSRFAAMKERRDGDALLVALRRLDENTRAGHNVFPAMIEAFEANATIGEVWGVFREASGYAYDPFGQRRSPLADPSTRDDASAGVGA